MNDRQLQNAGVTLPQRSLRGALISIALLAVASAFLSQGALPVISLLLAASALFFAIRGLPEALTSYAARRRSQRYFKVMSLVLPVGLIILSAYLALLLAYVLRSNVPIGLRLELPLALVVLSGLINVGVVALNIISVDRD